LVNAVHEQAPMKNVSEMDWEDWTPHINAIKANFNLCKQALPYLRKSENGRIIYISGGLSKRFYAGASAYSAAKVGINNFCKTLALEEAQYGTTVNIVAPGRVETDPFEDEHDEIWEEIDSSWDYKTPLNRNVTGFDVGETVAYFADPASACITGQTVFVASGEIIP
jgi:3-oxoacyl-[acyl-carrier protein] reductase